MKYVIVNFSGNTGKSTLAWHLFMPRVPKAEYIAVETINSDEAGENVEVVKGKQYGQLQEQLMLIENAIVDVGASNIEEFMRLMQQYRGSHEDFDMFIVPTVKDSKQVRDTIATIEALATMGVPAKKIRVVFNKLAVDDTVEDAFYPIIAYHEDRKAFSLRPKAALFESELYPRLRAMNQTVDGLLADTTNWKEILKTAKTREEKEDAAAHISMQRLAASAKENLDIVFAAITKKEA